jgi:hypothetical protein
VAVAEPGEEATCATAALSVNQIAQTRAAERVMAVFIVEYCAPPHERARQKKAAGRSPPLSGQGPMLSVKT